MASRFLLVSTTTWPTAARLASSFTKQSWQVEALAPSGAPVRHSRYVSRVHHYSAFAPLQALERAIRASDADLLLPCDDRAVVQLLRLHAQQKANGDCDIPALIARSLGATENYPTMMSRAAFLAEAAALNIVVPRTRDLEDEADLTAALSEFGLPIVLKTDGSWGGDGVVLACTAEEARAAFRRLARRPSALRLMARAMRRRDAHHMVSMFAPVPPRISIQAFVAGTPATTAFACWEGEFLAATHMDVVAGNGHTGPASVVRRVDDPAMEAATRKVARCFNLSGLHGLDFIRDPSGTVHLLEINPRATQTAALAFAGRTELAAALTARLSGRSVTGAEPGIPGDLVALFPQEWRRDPASPYLANAHHDVPWGDPALLRACLVEPTRLPLWRWIMGRPPAVDTASLCLGSHLAIASGG